MLYGRKPLFLAQIQHLEHDTLDPQAGTIQQLRTRLAHRGAVQQEVMPMAMRNLDIAQQRDRNRYQHVQDGRYNRPKATFSAVDFVLLKQKVANTLGVPVRPHILRVLALRGNGVARL